MNTQNKEPNIRFNQFKELWKVVKLASISQKVKSKNINNTFENVLTNSAEFGIIPQRDFFDKDIANLKSLIGYYVVQPNDFVYNPRISNKAPVGPIKVNFLNTTGVMSPLYYVFRTQNIDVFFLAKYFDSSYWHKFMKLNGDTGARSDRFAIKDSVFKEMPIPFPTIPEQSAIGSLFRTLDDLIASYKDNLTNYQSLKATMLSKMFPKAGQTVPEIRLNGFDAEWEIRKLSEVSEVYDGTHQTPNYTESGVKFLSVENISTLESEKYISEEDFEKDFKVFPEFGDVLMTRIGSIGVPNIVKTNEKIAFYVSLALLKPKKKTNSLFMKSSIESNPFQEELWKKTLHIAFPKKINKNDISQSTIKCPSYEEQQAIGIYFSNLDNLINSHQEKISQLETLKKKLLQDMFI